MKKDPIKKLFLSFVLTLILPMTTHAQEFGYYNGAASTYDYGTNYSYGNDYSYGGGNGYYPYAYGAGSYDPYESYGNAYYGDVYGNSSPRYDYSTIDYNHNYSTRGPNEFGRTSGHIQFGRKFDNSNNFTSGISSYQGTSTGPGPNGGYPGTPRGVYQTNYVNTSIYPNTYMRISPIY